MNRRLSFYTVIIFVTLLCGIIVVFIRYRTFDGNRRSQLSNYLNTVRAAVEPERVASLKGNSTDLENPDYLYLKKLLTSLSASHPNIRYVYLIRRVSGKFIFLVDTEPFKQGPDLASPGEIYDDAPASLIKLYTRNTTLTIGPYTDKWGTFISAMSPILDSRTQPIAIIGADIGAATWFYDSFVAIFPTSVFFLLLIYIEILIIVGNRRRLQYQLSQKYLASVLESSNDAIYSYDRDAIVTSWNPGAEKIYGFSAAEILGKNLTDFIIPSTSRAAFHRNLKSVLSGQIIKHQMSTRLNKLNQRIVIDLTESPLLDHNGKIIGASVVGRDVTNEHDSKVEIEKRNLELEKYKKAVDNASDHIIITDPEGVILYANAAVTRLTGYSNAEVIGKKAGSKDLWGGLMPKSFYEKMWHTIKRDKRNFHGEINNKRKSGQKYIALASISPVLDSRRNIIYFIGIERDATIEREVDRMKSEFVSFASHQLRTPLSAMKWFAEMLLAGDAGKLNKEQTEFVKNIYDSNERMVELVKDLLDISRIESGRIIIDPVPTDIVKLIKGVLTEVGVKAKSKHQKLIPSFNPNLPLVNLDPSLVRNVYLNLLTNSIKYTPEKGEITLFVSKSGANILTQVSDNGFGIPEDQQEQTFQKFFRATNAVRRETEGTGLGLYLVKAIVESSGGKIWFRSVEGKGTTFWFTLPIKGVPAKSGQVRLGS